MVNNFLTSGKLDTRLNTTNICLIHKKERPTRMTELRPLSLYYIKSIMSEIKGMSFLTYFRDWEN